MSLFSAAHLGGHPFSRSYGVILPSSLTMLLPSALGSPPHPPVSVCGTGPSAAIVAFLGGATRPFATPFSLRIACPAPAGGFASPPPRMLAPAFLRGPGFLRRVPTVLCRRSTGFSTCSPSPTRLRLGLGPGLPRADQLHPGNLGYSAGRIPTFLSLLIPAFSLRGAPPPLPVRLPRAADAPLPVPASAGTPRLRCDVSAPLIFGAGPLG